MTRDYEVIRLCTQGASRVVVVARDYVDPSMLTEIHSFVDSPWGREQAHAYVLDVQARQRVLGSVS